MKIRVLACGRAGTLYTTEVLKAAGLDVGHEYTGENGTVSSLAYGSPPYPLFEWEPPIGRCAHQGEDITQIPWDVTIHQVRHPLKTIESAFIVIPKVSWLYYERVIGISHRLPKLYRCMLYWFRWNVLCESISKFTYQLEKIEQNWMRICEEAKISAPFPAQISRTTNHKKRNQIPFADKKFKITGWEQLSDIDPVLTERIRELAKKYGYEL